MEIIKNAKWITSPVDAGAAAYTFRRDFALKGEVVKATLYASAMGIYVPMLNGRRVGDEILSPGWTSYKKRIQYQTYDVTDMLKEGNVLEIGLGQGWAVGHIGFYSQNHYSADYTSLIAAVELEYADGSREQILSDESFQVYTSEVTYSEMYYGETVDKTAPISLVGNAVLSPLETELVPQISEPVREQERLSAVELIVTPKGACYF